MAGITHHSLLPSALNFCQRRLFEVAGIFSLFIAGWLVLALLTYHSTDPSFNKAFDNQVLNWAGWLGATTSDLLFQLYGFSSYLIPPFLIMCGWILLTTHKAIQLFWRFPIFIMSLVLWSAFLSIFRLHSVIGNFLFEKSLLSIRYYVPNFPGIALAFLCAILSLIGLCIAFSVRRAHLMKALYCISYSLLYVYRFSTTLIFLKSSKSLAHLDKESPFLPFTPAESVQKKNPSNIRKKVFEHKNEQDSSLETIKTSSKDYTALDPFQLPPLELLHLPKGFRPSLEMNKNNLKEKADALGLVLSDYGIRGEIVGVHPGPVVTLYELEPAPGLKSSRVISLADDIARSMSAVSARVAVIPGKNVIGIELPNSQRETVHLRDLLSSQDYENSKTQLTLVLGKDISGQPVIADLAKMPHLLVAGTTGSGKSVAVNAMILSLIYRLPPERCKFIMIDPKMLELSIYEGIPHLLAPVVTDPKKAVIALKWVVREMESRYQAMSKLAVRNIEGYNQRVLEARAKGENLSRKVQTGFDPLSGTPLFEEQSLDIEPLPFIVVVVDEMADLMLVAGKEIEAAVQRLAQMARAAGIHLIMATQRPSVDVITGTIKANFPTRISFQVTSKIDSRTILGEQGAEQLLGQGDMLYMTAGGRIFRVHGPYVGDADVEKVVHFLKTQSSPSYLEEITAGDLPGEDLTMVNDEDELYQQALDLVLREGKASTSFIQRYLKIGYNRAARLIEMMETRGIITPANHVGKREILVSTSNT